MWLNNILETNNTTANTRMYNSSKINIMKYDNTNGMGKIPLRRLLEKYKMHSFVTKEKLGFNVNTVALWQSHGKRLCNRYLTNSRIVQDGWDAVLFLKDKFNIEVSKNKPSEDEADIL